MRMVFWTILFLLIVPLGLAAGALLGNRLPWTEPPGPLARLQIYLSTNEATLQSESPRPELQPARFSLPPEQLQTVVLAACKALDWTVENAGNSKDTSGIHITAVIATPILHFQDDVTIDIRSGGWSMDRRPEESILTATSRSRIGKGDFGANTRHLLDLLATVHKITGT
jgi:uncharacterized protein (DUF1499 family)